MKIWGFPKRVWYVRGLQWKLVGNFDSRKYCKSGLLRLWLVGRDGVRHPVTIMNESCHTYTCDICVTYQMSAHMTCGWGDIRMSSKYIYVPPYIYMSCIYIIGAIVSISHMDDFSYVIWPLCPYYIWMMYVCLVYTSWAPSYVLYIHSRRHYYGWYISRMYYGDISHMYYGDLSHIYIIGTMMFIWDMNCPHIYIYMFPHICICL